MKKYNVEISKGYYTEEGVPTILIRIRDDGTGMAMLKGYLQLFRGYRFQVSRTLGEHDYGSSRVLGGRDGYLSIFKDEAGQPRFDTDDAEDLLLGQAVIALEQFFAKAEKVYLPHAFVNSERYAVEHIEYLGMNSNAENLRKFVSSCYAWILVNK